MAGGCGECEGRVCEGAGGEGEREGTGVVWGGSVRCEGVLTGGGAGEGECEPAGGPTYPLPLSAPLNTSSPVRVSPGELAAKSALVAPPPSLT